MEITLTSTAAGIVIPVTGSDFTIGRSSQCDFSISNQNVISGHHCKIIVNEQNVFIQDTESRNGTFVNNTRLEPYVPVKIFSGDTVGLANIQFTVRIIAGEATRAKAQGFPVPPAVNTPAAANGAKVISFSSIEGGSGKTVFSLALANELSMSGKRVLYIDAEAVNTFQFYLKHTGFAPSEMPGLLANIRGSGYQAIKRFFGYENFFILPPINGFAPNFDIKADSYLTLIEMARTSGDFDYIIIDTDSLFNSFKEKLFNASDKVFLVQRPFADSAYKMEMFEKIADFSDEKFIRILNLYGISDYSSAPADTPRSVCVGSIRNSDDAMGIIKLVSYLN